MIFYLLELKYDFAVSNGELESNWDARTPLSDHPIQSVDTLGQDDQVSESHPG